MEASAEVLTRDRGWVTHDQLSIGDEILAYDPATDAICWEPVTDLDRYEDETELIHWKSGRIDIRTTPNHRWWTIAQHEGQPRKPQFMSTEHISGKYIRVKIGGGQPGAFRDDPVLSDELVELLGWVVTEGYFVRWVSQVGRKSRPCDRCQAEADAQRATRCPDCGRKGAQRPRQRVTAATSQVSGVHFTQSHAVNGRNVARIREMVEGLTGQGFTISETVYRNRGKLHSRWVFSGALGRQVRQLVPGKRLTPELLRMLTAAQAELLLDTLIAGDGHVPASGRRRYTQKDRGQLADVAMLCAMLGIRTALHDNGQGIGVLYIGMMDTLTGKHVHVRRVSYSGVVWWLTVRTGSFMARSRGYTFWTGGQPRPHCGSLQGQ
jgi:hypothetical protein